MRNYKEVLLDPADCVVAIIDEEPQMFFGVEGRSRASIENAVVGLSKAANAFSVPVVLSTVAAESFSGPLISKVQSLFPNQQPIDRTSLNSWEDANFRKAIDTTGKKKLVICGLWTEVCVTLPTLCAIFDGYDVYVVEDACGGSSPLADKMARSRMQQAGAKFVTWQALMLEWQRDWNNKDTYQIVMDIVKQHGGAYGMGVEYSEAMVPTHS
ncbi:MAG: hydrolase [Clostridiales bacterium]|jgi:nicotinamidase-related amidase|nr:hydrolase [Clostridiales bacterium]